jgi:hypothetical protein
MNSAVYRGNGDQELVQRATSCHVLSEVEAPRRFSVQYPTTILEAHAPSLPKALPRLARIDGVQDVYNMPEQAPITKISPRELATAPAQIHAPHPVEGCRVGQNGINLNHHSDTQEYKRRSRQFLSTSPTHPFNDGGGPQQRDLYRRPVEGTPLQPYTAPHQLPFEAHQPPFFMPSQYDYQSGKARKRSNLPKESTEIMKTWFEHVR